MIIDTSALVSIALDEAGSDAFFEAINNAPIRLMSVANAMEFHLVLTGKRLRHLYDGLLADGWIELRPVTNEHLTLARDAHDRFGRGNHAAGLNFGDCFAYALAKATGYPLLFKGDDFGRTDIEVAIV